MNLVELGQRIRALREKRNLKQRDVANALQISAQAVSKWERGENAPDIAILLDLTRLLGVSTDRLLGRGERLDDTFEATVFCTGLTGFAQRSAAMPPRDVAQWANGLFHLVTEAVVRHDGIPIKYVGDGFLGFFSGPNHAQRALQAALDARRAAPVPDLVITLHSGEIYLGRIGHTEYARTDIIGDTVNTAFLAMHWTSENLKGGLSVTAETVEKLGECRAGFKFSRPHLADIRILKRRLKLHVPQRAAAGPF